MRCVLVGNYGVGNVGDEALREYFLAAFPEVEWTIVTADGVGEGEVPRLPLGVRSLLRPWWRTLRAMRRADAIVFGGGSLFTDVESLWACFIWRSYASVAALFGKPYLMAFQGVGPWRTGIGRRIARKTYRYARFVSVRDEESHRRVRELHPSEEPVLSFDPAFARFSRHPKGAASGKRSLAVIPRANATEAFFTAVNAELQKPWDDITVLLLEPAMERGVSERLRNMIPVCRIVDIVSVDQFLTELSAASDVVTQRYHGAIAALALQIPFTVVPQKPGDKMDALRSASDHMSRSAYATLVENGEKNLRKALEILQ